MSKKEETPHRKVYICFLGTNRYVLCNYYFDNDLENHCVKNVRFVQEAIARHECKDWTENDRILVFLTKKAKEENWDDGNISKDELDEQAAKLENSQWGKEGDPKWGLKTQLEKLADEGLFPKDIIKPIENVDDGVSEEAIWNLFNLMNDQIEEGDEIYFDFTSGFRNLSMLGMVLLTYLKNTKNVSIGEIYYGAFEKLGFAQTVRENMPMEERKAPVLRLKDLSNIMDFSNAANAFVKYGNGMQLYELLESWRRNLAKNKKMGGIYSTLYELRCSLFNLTLSLQTCRGGEIVNAADIKKIFKLLSNVNAEDENVNEYKALRPIFDLIKDKFKSFDENESTKNGFIASEWCYENGMYQQSMTLLQETLVSYCAEVAGLDYSTEDQRAVVEYYLGRSKVGHDENEWKTKKLRSIGFNEERCAEIEKRMCKIDENMPKNGEDLSKMSELSIFYEQLTNLRNDLNHGGFLKKRNSYVNRNGEFIENTETNACAQNGKYVENECRKKIDKFRELKTKFSELDEESTFNEIFGDVLPTHWNEEDRSRIECDLRTAMQYLNSAYSQIMQMKRVDEGNTKLTRNTQDIVDETRGKLAEFDSLRKKGLLDKGGAQ